MISVSWTFNNQSTNWGQKYFSNQLGPVTWPANGFIAPDNRIATCGHSHPSSILDNGYMYIFYSDAGPWGDHMPQEEGRLRGIKVLRVLQTESLDPGKYQVYYKDPAGNVSWSSSLPAGFSKDNMLQYARVKGPKSTDVLNNNSNSAVIRFSVAKVRNTNYFIGIEEYMDLTDVCSPGVSKYKLALRFSTDLVNWSDRMMHVTTPKCWDQHNMRYPIFLDKTGWTNTEVDLDDFYILGTAGINKSVNKLRVYKYVPPPPPPSDCPPHHPCNPAFAAKLSNSSKESHLELAKENISVFPNPVKDYLNINVVTNSRTSFQVEIYDSNGRLVKATNSELLQIGTNQRRISVSGMTKGIYFVRINKNNKSVFSKFVIL